MCLDYKLHLSRLHTRQVNNVVDELQQQVVVGEYGINEHRLFLGRIFFPGHCQELRESHDGIQRSAYLVTHVGEERLLQCRLLSQSAGLVELELLELVVIHLEQHSVRTLIVAFGVNHSLAANLIPVPLAVAIEVGLHLSRIRVSAVYLIHSREKLLAVVGMYHTHKLVNVAHVRLMSIVMPEGVAQIDGLAISLPCEGVAVFHRHVI